MAHLRGGSTIGGYPILGKSGNDNYVPKIIGNTLENSLIYDNGSTVSIDAGDGTYGTTSGVSLSLGTDGSKTGTLRFYGTSSGSYGLIQNTTNNLHIDAHSGLYLNHYKGNAIQIGSHMYMNNHDIYEVGQMYTNQLYFDLYGSGSSGGRILLRARASNGQIGMYDDYNNRWYLRQYNGGNLILDPIGNLGVGATSPNTQLHVYDSGTNNGNVARFQAVGGSLYIQPDHIHNDMGSLHIGSGTNLLYLRGTNIGIGTTSPHTSYTATVGGDMLVTGWLRTDGSEGWYNNTHGGGWYMTDTTWIRAYNNKNILTGGTTRSNSGFEHFGSAEWYMLNLGTRQASSGSYGIGLTNAESNRQLSFHVPDVDAYSTHATDTTTAPSFTWRSNGATQLMKLESKTGNLWVKGNATLTGNELEIQGASPQVRFTDTSQTSNKHWWVHVNSGRLYFLHDSDGNGTWDSPHSYFYTDKSLRLANNLWLGSNGAIYSSYNSNYIFRDHNNGHVTVNGAGGDLYLGYINTGVVRLQSNLVQNDGVTVIASTNGTLHYQGNNTDSRYARLGRSPISDRIMSGTNTTSRVSSVAGTTTDNWRDVTTSSGDVYLLDGETYQKVDYAGDTIRVPGDGNYYYIQTDGINTVLNTTEDTTIATIDRVRVYGHDHDGDGINEEWHYYNYSGDWEYINLFPHNAKDTQFHNDIRMKGSASIYGKTTIYNNLHVRGWIDGVDHIGVYSGDKQLVFSDANPTWRNEGYGGEITINGDNDGYRGLLHVGGVNVKRHLRVNGHVATNVHSYTGNVTLGMRHRNVLMSCSTANLTVHLPNASSYRGTEYVIKKIDSTTYSVVIDPYSTQTIDGASTKSLTTQYETVKVVSDGSNWFVV